MKRRMSLLMGSLVSLIAAMGGVCASAAEFARSASIVNYDTGETFWVLPVVIIGGCRVAHGSDLGDFES